MKVSILIYGLVMVILTGCHPSHDVRSDFPRWPLHAATIPSPQQSPTWLARVKSLDGIAGREHIRLVFLGDSITQGWEKEGRRVWEQYYAKRQAANFGVNGDTTESLLWRIQHGTLQGLNPRLVVLLIGVNNTSPGASPQEITDGVKAVLLTIQHVLPRTKVLVLGIFPTGQHQDHPRRVKARKANQLMEGMVEKNEGLFLDIGGTFLEEDGSISTEVMPDFLHLSPFGYQLWAHALESTIRAYYPHSVTP